MAAMPSHLKRVSSRHMDMLWQKKHGGRRAFLPLPPLLQTVAGAENFNIHASLHGGAPASLRPQRPITFLAPVAGMVCALAGSGRDLSISMGGFFSYSGFYVVVGT